MCLPLRSGPPTTRSF
jgi:hypothetical protein